MNQVLTERGRLKVASALHAGYLGLDSRAGYKHKSVLLFTWCQCSQNKRHQKREMRLESLHNPRVGVPCSQSSAYSSTVGWYELN